MSLRNQCMCEANQFGKDLSAWDCVDIIDDVYGKRRYMMKIDTIKQLIKDMMNDVDLCVEEEDLKCAVRYFLIPVGI